jgi:hypothetical protein
MPDQPLQPFGSQNLSFGGNPFMSSLFGGVSSGQVLEWFLYAIFAFWALYTLIAIYHWLKYSHGALIALPAIGVHLFISVALMSYTLSGNAFSLTPYLP